MTFNGQRGRGEEGGRSERPAVFIIKREGVGPP